jgi:hypothetical protein
MLFWEKAFLGKVVSGKCHLGVFRGKVVQGNVILGMGVRGIAVVPLFYLT